MKMTYYRSLSFAMYSCRLWKDQSNPIEFELTVNIEVIVCGTLVIMHRTGEGIIDEQSGIVVPIGDMTTLKDAICKIRQRSKSFHSSHCIERVLGVFKKEERLAKYISLYDELTANN